MKTKKFERAGQLYQLRRLNPAAHKAARTALNSGMVSLAGEIVRRAILAAFDRLVAGQQQARPELVPILPTGVVICDAYHENSDPDGPHLIRCRKRARYQLTLRAGGEVQTLSRCRVCRDELREKEPTSTFEILDEQLITKGGVS